MKPFQQYTLILLTIAMVYVGCKEKQLPEMPARKRAYLHFVNFNKNYTGIDFNVTAFETKKNLFENLGYPLTWPQSGYASLLTLQDDAKDTGWIYFNIRKHTTGDTIIPETQLRLFTDVNNSSTMILLDNGGVPEVVKTLDNFDEDTDSTGNIRFMNLDPLIPSATMVSTDTNKIVKIENLGYKSFTGFRKFKKGKHTLRFLDNMQPNVAIDSFPDFEIKLKRNYAFYLIYDYSVTPPKHRVIMEEMNR